LKGGSLVKAIGEWVQILRFSFARGDLVRRIVPGKPSGCDECGNSRRGGNLFEFGWWPDDGKPRAIRGQFCSKACAESYHGGVLVSE
jgi:hypothetical protein